MHMVLEGRSNKKITASLISRFILKGIKATDMTLVLGPVITKLPNGGLEGIAILAESHITVCADRHQYIYADVFSCQPFNPEGILKLAQKLLGIKILKWERLNRGLEFLPKFAATSGH